MHVKWPKISCLLHLDRQFPPLPCGVSGPNGNFHSVLTIGLITDVIYVYPVCEVVQIKEPMISFRIFFGCFYRVLIMISHDGLISK